MGTRALITIETGSKTQKTPLLKIYKHWDGYLDHLGMIIFKFLKKAEFSGGVVEGDKNTVICNGTGEFAANFLTYLKELSKSERGLHPNLGWSPLSLLDRVSFFIGNLPRF